MNNEKWQEVAGGYVNEDGQFLPYAEADKLEAEFYSQID